MIAAGLITSGIVPLGLIKAGAFALAQYGINAAVSASVYAATTVYNYPQAVLIMGGLISNRQAQKAGTYATAKACNYALQVNKWLPEKLTCFRLHNKFNFVFNTAS